MRMSRYRASEVTTHAVWPVQGLFAGTFPTRRHARTCSIAVRFDSWRAGARPWLKRVIGTWSGSRRVRAACRGCPLSPPSSFRPKRGAEKSPARTRRVRRCVPEKRASAGDVVWAQEKTAPPRSAFAGAYDAVPNSKPLFPTPVAIPSAGAMGLCRCRPDRPKFAVSRSHFLGAGRKKPRRDFEGQLIQ